jgi:hypothetical protein
MSLIPFGFWAASGAGGGGGPAYDLLETTTLASTASSITFSGLGAYSDYAHLQLRMVLKSSASRTTTGIFLRLNGSTTNDYAVHSLYAQSSTMYSTAAVNTPNINLGVMPAATATPTDAYAAVVTDILDFSNTNKKTTTRSLSGFNASVDQIRLTSSLYLSNDAITQVSLIADDPDLAIGCRFSIYGVK